MKKKCKDGSLVIRETDKTKKLSVMTRENFIASTDSHIVQDKVISAVDMRAIERTLNAHTLQLSIAFLISFNQGDHLRLKIAMRNEFIFPPPLSAARKDHKLVSQHLEAFGPPSRPIGDGNKAPVTQLSWILAKICKKTADALQNPYECASTEKC